MKNTELTLLKAVYEQPNIPWLNTSLSAVKTHIRNIGVYKQNLYYLKKWVKKGWYDYGFNMEQGWLTDEGKRAAEGLFGPVEARSTVTQSHLEGDVRVIDDVQLYSVSLTQEQRDLLRTFNRAQEPVNLFQQIQQTFHELAKIWQLFLNDKRRTT